MKYVLFLVAILVPQAGSISAQSETTEVFPQVAVEYDAEFVAAWGQRFRDNVRQCWNVAPETGAGKISVTVGFRLGLDGKIIGDVTLVTSSPGGFEDVQDAFKAARLAILRCEGDGYERPPTFSDDGLEIELVFNLATAGRS